MNIVIQSDRNEDQCYVAFSNDELTDTAVARTQRIGEDIALDFDADGRLLGLDVTNATRVLGPTFWDVRLDELVGVKEAAALAGVQKPNFVRDYANRPDFPAPAVELAAGRIWRRSQVQAWLTENKKKPGPRAKAGL